MYKETEEQINDGLSPLKRILLGLVSGLFGLMMVGIAPDNNKQIHFYLLGAFCLVIFLSCIFKGRAQQFLGSVIGLCLVTLSIWYLASQIIEDGPLLNLRSEQSIFNAILFTVFFGLPGLSYAAQAKFGFIKKPNP